MLFLPLYRKGYLSKEFFGYTSSNGQLTNTGTTITDAFGNKINVLPEDQHSIAIVHSPVYRSATARKRPLAGTRLQEGWSAAPVR